MSHLQKIKKAMRDANEKIASYESTVRIMKGMKGGAVENMIEESRSDMADVLMHLYQTIEPTVKAEPTPTGSDNTVTRAEAYYL